jgi:uncharacterized protein YpuA (DUF1002 family)
MLRVLIASLFVVGAVQAVVDPNQLPAEFEKLVPKQVREYYQNLTTEQKTAVAAVHKEHNHWENPQGALEALKAANEDAYTKALELHEQMKESTANLTDGAKKFSQEVDKILSTLVSGNEAIADKTKDAATQITSKYEALTDEDRQSFRSAFRDVSKAIECKHFRAIAGLKGKFKGSGRSKSSSSSSESNEN